MRKRHFLTAFFLCSIIGLVGYKVYKKNMEPSSEVSKPVKFSYRAPLKTYEKRYNRLKIS